MEFLTLCLFVIQCACVHVLAVIFICDMFHVLCSRLCVGRVKGTISKMLCICYHQDSIVPAVFSYNFLLLLHKLIIVFFHFLYSTVVASFFLGQFKLWIRLKLVYLSVAGC